jgi:hypothetical protein
MWVNRRRSISCPRKPRWPRTRATDRGGNRRPPGGRQVATVDL